MLYTVPYLKVPEAYYVLIRYKSSDRDMLPLPIHKVTGEYYVNSSSSMLPITLWIHCIFDTDQVGIYTHHNSTQDF